MHSIHIPSFIHVAVVTCPYLYTGAANSISLVQFPLWPTLVHGVNETTCDVIMS